jgi:hypothetical protein
MLDWLYSKLFTGMCLRHEQVLFAINIAGFYLLVYIYFGFLTLGLMEQTQGL